jgi:uncharacterized cupin superfamily protein
VPNLFDPEFDELRGHEGFKARRARIGRQAGADRLGLSIWEVPPGQAAYPYHLHLGEEKVLIVLSGRPSLRTPDGWRELDEGDVVGFPVGEEGAHQVANRTDAVVRFLAVSTSGVPDVVLYPDSGKLGAAERRPGGLHQFFRQTDAVDYYEGERPPEGS